MSSNEKAGTVDASEVVAAPVRDVYDGVSWYKQPILRRLYFLMVFLFVGSSTLGYDASLLNGLQTMNSWQDFFGHPTGSRLGIFGAILGFGGLLMLFATPYIADYCGRRIGAGIGCMIVILGALLQALPPKSNPEAMYLAGRFIMGMGFVVNNACCPLLITEIAHPNHRGKMTTIYNTLFYLGAILAAWTTYGTLNGIAGDLSWRLPSGLQCAMPGIQLLALSIIPESPRWLISKGRLEEAKQILTHYHGNGQETDFVDWEFNEINITLRLEKEASSSNGWLDLVRTPGNRKRCILILLTAIFSQCSGNGLVSYYLSPILKTIGITEPSKQAAINGGLTIWCWLISIGCAFLVDRVGRRTLFLGAGVGMLISFTIWTACSAVYSRTGDTGAGSAVLAMIFLFYGVTGLAWPGLSVAYTAEILPFHIRAKGLTVFQIGTNCAGIFNQYVNPIGIETLAWKFYFVYIVVLVIEVAVIYVYYVETRGPTLEEIAVLFDGPDSAAFASAATGEKMSAQRREDIDA